MSTITVDETPATGNEVTLTMTLRGDVEKVVHAFVHGFPREALQQLADAFKAELAKRSDDSGHE